MRPARATARSPQAAQAPSFPNLFGDLQATCPRCGATIVAGAGCGHIVGETADLFSGQHLVQLDTAPKRRRGRPQGGPHGQP